ncbi:MAG: hypothetical protein ACYS7Y_04470 [Planctomycetota bacterium]|jgi:hypothetical protein
MDTYPDLSHDIDAARQAKALGATVARWRPEPKRRCAYGAAAPNPAVVVYFFNAKDEVGYTICGVSGLVEISRSWDWREVERLESAPIEAYLADPSITLNKA